MIAYNPNQLNHKNLNPIAKRFEDTIIEACTGVSRVYKRVRILKNSTMVFSYFVDTGDDLSREFVFDSVVAYKKNCKNPDKPIIESSIREPSQSRATAEFRVFQSAVFYCEAVKLLTTKDERDSFLSNQKINYPNISSHITNEPHNVVKYYSGAPLPNVPDVTFTYTKSKTTVKILYPAARVIRNAVVEVVHKGELVAYKATTLTYAFDAPSSSCSFPLSLNKNSKQETIQRAMFFVHLRIVPKFVLQSMMLERNIEVSAHMADLGEANESLKAASYLNFGHRRRIKSIISDIEERIAYLEKPLIYPELMVDTFIQKTEKIHANFF